jgi:hypothetical protein
MKSSYSTTSSKTDVKFIVREGIFFVAFFLYVWLRINPALYNQRQDPVFLVGFNFFRGFLNHPGGLVEYGSALLSQLYYFPLLGALVVTATAWAVARLTAALIRAIRPGYLVQAVHYIPVILLLILHSQYKHPLAVSLGLVLSLLFVFFQFRIGRNVVLRIASYVVLGVILYYAAAGPFLLFALMCVLYEAFCLRRPIFSAFYLLIAATIPFLAKETLFLINNRTAYLYLLPFQESYKPVFTPHFLIFFYLLLFLIYNRFAFRWFDFLTKLGFKKMWLRFGLQTLVVITIAGLAVIFSFEKNTRLLLQVDRYARYEKWQELIRLSKREQSTILSVAFQTHRALFHTGQLLEDMFSFPQNNGVSGLMMPRKFSESAPLQESDFCFDLGSINESRHWAYEAVATDGETPWILKRLAVVNFVSGDFRAAERNLNVLDKTLFFKGWAREFRKILQNPALASEDKTLNHGRSMLVKTDFIAFSSHPTVELDSLLKENPKNKMAFEYRIAHELLSCRLGGLPKRIEMLKNFHYRSIPRHLEEALIGLWSMSRKRELPQVFQYIHRQTFQHFRDFNQIIAKHRGDRTAAEAELRKRFGNTYWFYMIYNNRMKHTEAQASSKARGIE